MATLSPVISDSMLFLHENTCCGYSLGMYPQQCLKKCLLSVILLVVLQCHKFVYLLICNEFMACYGTENGQLPHIFIDL